MTTPNYYFTDFLAAIRLQPDVKAELQAAHQDLTDRLGKYDKLKPIFVSTFLQGSYKRATIVDPADGGAADVDVVVVTGLDEHAFPLPSMAMDLFTPFLNDNYPGLWKPQDRSFGIDLGHIEMDMVITSAPSEAVRTMLEWRAVKSRLSLDDDPNFRVRGEWVEPGHQLYARHMQLLMEADDKPLGAWSDEPLRIPDRKQQWWEPTHPIAQIDWTVRKNKRCNGHYINIVRCIKWWRRSQPVPKYPKGYPLEALVGECCPDGVQNVAEGLVRTLEEIQSRHEQAAQLGQTPTIVDHGVNQNVLARVSPTDFAQFHKLIGPAAQLARAALDEPDRNTSVRLWQKLLGPRFPDPPEQDRGGSGPAGPKGGFSPRESAGLVGGGRFA